MREVRAGCRRSPRLGRIQRHFRPPFRALNWRNARASHILGGQVFRCCFATSQFFLHRSRGTLSYLPSKATRALLPMPPFGGARGSIPCAKCCLSREMRFRKGNRCTGRNGDQPVHVQRKSPRHSRGPSSANENVRHAISCTVRSLLHGLTPLGRHRRTCGHRSGAGMALAVGLRTDHMRQSRERSRHESTMLARQA